jgi:membrane protein DedA with SNARE-associated domain
VYDPPVSIGEQTVEVLTQVVVRTGPWAPAVLFLASFIEYVFPPFPGDLLLVLAAWYSAHGALSWTASFLWVTAGALIGAWIDWRVGVWLAPRLARRAEAGEHPFAAKLRAFEAGYARWGSWLLVLNRFMPGIRAFLFVAAGASGMPLWRVLLLGGVSACAWNALLLAAGAFVAREAGELVLLFERYTRAAWAVLAVAAALLLLRAAWRRARGATPGGGA